MVYEYDDSDRMVKKIFYHKTDIASEMIKFFYEHNNLIRTE